MIRPQPAATALLLAARFDRDDIARELIAAGADVNRRNAAGRTALGLWLLGVPLALTLGMLTGILNFVPNFGPLIAGVPAALVALLVSPRVALYTLLLYVVIQMLDGYVFTPLVDRRSVELPPVLTITAQVLLGVLVGALGVVLASPLVASVIVVVRRLYVEDALGDDAGARQTATG